MVLVVVIIIITIISTAVFMFCHALKSVLHEFIRIMLQRSALCQAAADLIETASVIDTSNLSRNGSKMHIYVLVFI